MTTTPRRTKTRTRRQAETATLAAELVSWAVGVAFGRFDVRLATGARRCSRRARAVRPAAGLLAGMLTGDDGLPLPAARRLPARLPRGRHPRRRPGPPARPHRRGARGVRHGLRRQRRRWWQEVAALLDPRTTTCAPGSPSSFFDHHLKRHSKSRRKAPILWQLGTPSGRYSVWLYAHRLTRDSSSLQNDVVGAEARPRGAPAHGPRPGARVPTPRLRAQGDRRAGGLRRELRAVARRGQAGRPALEPGPRRRRGP